jgi:hypothetical protein
MKLRIDYSVASKRDMAALLQYIMMQIHEGFTSGYEPNWELIPEEGDEEPI